MTPAEYQALDDPTLPHAARTLYCMQLRRHADGSGRVGPILYPEIGKALAVREKNSQEFSFQINASQLTELFEQLMSSGLLILAGESPVEHYHGASFELPLLRQSPQSPVPQQQFAIHLEWRPDSGFATLAKLCGLSDPNFAEEELGEFIAFWLGRPDVFKNQHQWMIQFIRSLKNNRYVRRSPTAPQPGYQKSLKPSPPKPAKDNTRAKEMIAAAQQFNPRADDEES
ncbi:DnaT-like ssDNA-binding domain-containing protein [Dongshaea marina]|uniref:DnaT-like ssDNA-binding domain-containing protein n=1 Tax=Dongshaea marina TaxID=2047966 RepID=UPI000D3EA5E3|nr:DnaT-like ssDNA-binding domain-containing protein [Dongshaea marina]